MKSIIVCLTLLLVVGGLFCQTVTPDEFTLLQQMLERAGQRPDDVDFLKDWGFDTRLKLPVMVDILQHPFHYPAFVDGMATAADSGAADANLRKYADILGWADSLSTSGNERFAAYCRANVKKPEDVFWYVDWVWTAVEAEWNAAWDSLDATQRNDVQALALTLWRESEDSLAYRAELEHRGLTEPDSMGTEQMMALVERVNFSRLAQAANLFQSGFAALRDNLEGIAWGKRVDKVTRWGRMVVGSDAADNYALPCCFILDPAGDDNYRCELATSLKHPFLWVLDLDGNDNYTRSGPSELFAARCGLVAFYDRAGDDTYRGGDMLFSAQFGWLDATDAAGDDLYDAGQVSLGAAGFGVAVLHDDAGRDSYAGTQFSQGFGRPLGIGLLADRTGPDHYYAGGRYLHAPLAPLDYRSLSQGFGFGMRPDIAGGIGMLYDGGGNDSYQGGVYAQGVAYWYALGILYDRSGNDYYNAVYYPQGSGIHLAAGFLFDGDGEDSYYSKHGPGQGAAHDYGVGWLIDRGGDDSYNVEGGNGLALTNSVAVFLDVSGNDRYNRVLKDNYGVGKPSRETGSLGLFLDTGGTDIYPFFGDVPREQRPGENRLWSRDLFGVGLDTLLVSQPAVLEEMAEEQAADVDSLAPIEEIFAIASEWGVGSAARRVELAGGILLSRDAEASAYIYEHALGTKDGLTYRAITLFAQKSKTFGDYLPRALEHPDSLWQKNAMALVGELELNDYLGRLADFAARGQYKPAALSAIGSLKTDEAVRVLEGYANDPSERVRVIVARGLKYIGSKSSRAALHRMKDDPSFLVRTMVLLAERNKQE